MVVIFVVLTILFFIILDVIIHKIRGGKLVIAVQNENSIRLPKGLFYSTGHTWANIQLSGNVKVGIDDFVQKLMGNISEIQVQPIGKTVKQGETLVQIKQGNRVLSFASPVDGTVTKINDYLLKNPVLLQQSPYQASWIYEIQPTNLSYNLPKLLVGERSIAWLKIELSRLRDFLSSTAVTPTLVGQTMQDGGIPANGLLEQLNDQSWDAFQKQFLTK